MLDSLFMQILDMTAISSLVIGIVLLARLALKKQPKIFSYCLWAVVLLRLLCPVSISMPVSLLPAMPAVENHYVLSDQPLKPEHVGTALEDTFQSATSGQLGQQQQTIIIQDPDYNYGRPYEVTYDWWNILVLLGQYAWLLGVVVMIAISLAQLLKLKKRLREAARLRDNIYICDQIDTAFVMGLIKPKIYLPASLTEQEQSYILLHEQHHIHRFDHIFKALGYAALCLHWFNPLVWLAFILAGRDMEMSCDEAVIRKSGEDIRADYSATLLRLSTGRTTIAGAPLAFGEGDAGKRIRNLSKWKKPALWAGIVATVCCIAVIALCAVNSQPGTETVPSQPDTGINGAPTPQAGPAELVFDRDTAPGQDNQTFTMPEYPGVTFQLHGHSSFPSIITSVSATENGETNTVISSSGIRNLYLSDLNGDGKRELCASVYWGSGIEDAHIEVYDYTDRMAYSLWERMEYDYWLTADDNILFAHRKPYNPNVTQKEVLGTLALGNQQLLFISYPEQVSSRPAEAVFSDHSNLHNAQSFTMPEFPGATFKLESSASYLAHAVTVSENGKEKTVLMGTPITSLYLADLNGDGNRELCAVVSTGSGYVSSHIQVYDHTAQKIYELSDPMEYDYALHIAGSMLWFSQFKSSGAPPSIQDDPRPIAAGYLTITNENLSKVYTYIENANRLLP